ncbi:hypothetical protein FGO68_gene10186 [Halteria grandinella]|uniref:Uncharacterized protein n=1 Tax=Halteria grandinella TaxID=5974 RepID=A0A8J8T2I3_HALGN|nr:hypothetical protein FGO68_gene10186 [Halteria grandinella]
MKKDLFWNSDEIQNRTILMCNIYLSLFTIAIAALLFFQNNEPHTIILFDYRSQDAGTLGNLDFSTRHGRLQGRNLLVRF